MNLSEVVAGWSSLAGKFFPFITLSISCHTLLACSVSSERSAVKLMGIPLLFVAFPFLLLPFSLFAKFFPPRHAHGDLTSLAPHERLPEILVVPREKTPTGSPPGSPVPGILQARTLEWVVISFDSSKRSSSLSSWHTLGAQ